MTINFNELDNKAIQPVKLETNTDKYQGTDYFYAYQKGLLGAKMTLDEKNKDKILENLIKIIMDDVLEQNSKNISSNSNILKLNLQVIENALKNTKLSNFDFDVKRIACIIEGYGKFIEQQNSK